MSGDLLWIDNARDKQSPSDGVSRYGVYLRQNLAAFEDADTPEYFAMAAWQVAAEEMTPGYLVFRPDLHGINLGLDEDTHAMFAAVHVPVPNTRALWPMTEATDTWRPSSVPFSDAPIYDAPAYRAERVAILPTVEVRVPINSNALPDPVGTQDTAELRRVATAALASLVSQIQHAAGPLVAQLRR